MDLEKIRADGKTVLLSFSNGKDSLCAWVELLAAGFDVRPFYMQLVPGLEFVEKSLRYYEEFFGCHILRVLHPNLWASIDKFEGQPPGRRKAIEFLSLPIFDYEDTERGVRRTLGVSANTWVAVGLKYCDSVARKNRMPPDGINRKSRRFYPIADFNKEMLIQSLCRAKVKLPVDYKLFGRSFDGIDYRFLSVIKREYPQDYARILEFFPAQDLELFRAEVAERHGQAKRLGC